MPWKFRDRRRDQFATLPLKSIWSVGWGLFLVFRSKNLSYFKEREIIRNVERLHHQKDQQERERLLPAWESVWNFFWTRILWFCSMKKISRCCGWRFRKRSKCSIFYWPSNYSHIRASSAPEEEQRQINDLRTRYLPNPLLTLN